MLDIVKHININEKEYPLAFTLNVMESIQDKYGSMKKWGEILQPKNEEPKVKDLKWTFTEFINEGIDIENEDNEGKRPFVTTKQVGRLVSSVGMGEITAIMHGLTIDSMKTDSPNERTTQEMTSPNQTL